MTDQNTALVQDSPNESQDWLAQFESASQKNQLQQVSQLISNGKPGIAVLMKFLRSRQGQTPNLVMGKIYQALYQLDNPETQEFLQTYFPTGIVPLQSGQNIDYLPLQQLLVKQDFQAADHLTLVKLCELAGSQAVARGWLYFTEVEKFPPIDLQTIDNLWLMHSEGKFGFSVQRTIWLSVGKNFVKLWPKIAWKTGNKWTRYPDEFIWDLSAPTGHLPLSNQLRGVRVINSLLSHQAWLLSANK